MSEPVEVRVSAVDPKAKIPTKGSIYAAGWDLYAIEETIVPFRKSVKVRTGIHVAIPNGFEGQVRARSSLGKKGLILPHSIGTIDSDYRGQHDSYTITEGERIAQLLISPIPEVYFTEVSIDDLGITERGHGGFGSTGKF